MLYAYMICLVDMYGEVWREPVKHCDTIRVDDMRDFERLHDRIREQGLIAWMKRVESVGVEFTNLPPLVITAVSIVPCPF